MIFALPIHSLSPQSYTTLLCLYKHHTYLFIHLSSHLSYYHFPILKPKIKSQNERRATSQTTKTFSIHTLCVALPNHAHCSLTPCRLCQHHQSETLFSAPPSSILLHFIRSFTVFCAFSNGSSKSDTFS